MGIEYWFYKMKGILEIHGNDGHTAHSIMNIIIFITLLDYHIDIYILYIIIII